VVALPTDRRFRAAYLPAVMSPGAPTAAAIISGLAFLAVRPDVGDLQAALARQSAAANGVGLTYWFTWFGGGTTPGNYSVLTPYLSTLLGAPLLGVLATVLATPLAHEALRGTRWPVAGTWIATGCAACDLWSGRIPFALGVTAGLLAVLGVRRRWPLAAVAGAVVSSLCSPVSGAFLALGLAATFVVDRPRRRVVVLAALADIATLLIVAAVFGNPGRQTFTAGSMTLTLASTLLLLVARPSRPLQVLVGATALAAPLLWLIPNGLGSNLVRLPWLCLPAAVFATADAALLRRLVAVVPALTLCFNATVVDLVKGARASSSTSYYSSLITQVGHVPQLRNYRLEVVDEPSVHTAAYALLGHATLAGGYESQEQNQLNGVLANGSLDAVSYKVWLDNSAVGYIAVNRRAHASSPEFRLVTGASGARPGYLVPVSSDARWVVYRVVDPTPIVPSPARLVDTSQASMTIDVPCACALSVRVRYSRFLQASRPHVRAAQVTDDGTGWTQLRTYSPGRYVLSGTLVR
jgi:hypothetical protein